MPKKDETPKPCTENLSDAIARLKARDSAAWECVIHHCSPRLTTDTRISLRKRLSENGLRLTDDEESQVVDEIVDEVWVKLLDLIGDFVYHDDEKWFRYLRSIAINGIRRWVKTRVKDEQSLSLDAADEMSDETSSDRLLYFSGYAAPSSEAQLIAIQIIRALPQIYDELKLNGKHAEIFHRHYLNNEPIEALAAEYGMQPKSVTQVLRRILPRIVKRIRPYFD